MPTIVFRGTRAELAGLLRGLPAVLAGRAPDSAGVARGVQLRMGVALLSQVQQAFVAKSRGGVGSDGIKWAPLKPATIARRRRSAGDKREAGQVLRLAKAYGWRRRPTVVQLYGYRQVDILRDTGKLFRSLSPGVEDRPSHAEGQVFELVPGAAIVGTNVPYAATHQNGDPARNIPARPLWPRGGTIPPAWWPAVRDAGMRGVVLAITRTLGG